MYEPNEVINPDHRVMEVLLGLAGWAHKTYVFPSQRKILELLRDFTGRRMSLRTLARHLRALERDLQLRRQRRYPKNVAGELVHQTTLYWPGGRFLARAERLGRGLMGWAKARDQRNARSMLPDSANNLQPLSAVGRRAPVDNRGPPRK